MGWGHVFLLSIFYVLSAGQKAQINSLKIKLNLCARCIFKKEERSEVGKWRGG